MQLEWTDGPEAFATRAAAHVAGVLAETPAATVALPTGTTPIGLYARLLALAETGEATLAHARYFNLDEYVGVPPSDPHSFADFLRRHFLDPASIEAGHIRLLRGDAPDIAAEAAAHDAAVAALGGLDLAILGLGGNGHIAFNEPGADWDAGTHVVPLTEETRKANAAYFADGFTVPSHGLTMGIGMIRAARRVLLMVSGGSKAEALAALLAGRADPVWPVTALCGHPGLAVVADAALKPSR
ncbi:MAG: glucosamine-6-phosphate deaminase [Proteobacteria bacterium]|nr:glucosamine-6-phosphate deaminase [Pseudomonadota bacterium]